MAWRKHLGSEAGVAGMLFLRESTPSVIPGQGELAFQAGLVEGWRRCLDNIPNVIAEPQKEPVEIENR
jgi:hypothetical protein